MYTLVKTFKQAIFTPTVMIDRSADLDSTLRHADYLPILSPFAVPLSPAHLSTASRRIEAEPLIRFANDSRCPIPSLPSVGDEKGEIALPHARPAGMRRKSAGADCRVSAALAKFLRNAQTRPGMFEPSRAMCGWRFCLRAFCRSPNNPISVRLGRRRQ